MHRRRCFGQGNIPIVAPLRVCRRGFEAFGCAFMVSLPQTASGGDLPTAEELQQIGDVAGILSWSDLWQATVSGLRIPQGEIQRDLTALEVGHVAMVRRIARLRLGLAAHDEPGTVAHTPRRRLGFGGPKADVGGARFDSVLVTAASRSSWTWRWSLGSVFLHRPKFWRCTHPASSCDEPSLPRTSSPPSAHLSSALPFLCFAELSDSLGPPVPTFVASQLLELEDVGDRRPSPGVNLFQPQQATCITRTLTGKLESPLRAANARMTRSSPLGATSAKHWTAISLTIASSTSRHLVTASTANSSLATKSAIHCQAAFRTRTSVSSSLTKSH